MVEIQTLFISLQAAATFLMAALLWQLTRALNARFLWYWIHSGLTLTLGLLSLRASYQFPVGSWSRHISLTIYLFATLHCLFLFWAGLRNYVSGRLISRREYAMDVLFLIYALSMPIWYMTYRDLMPVVKPVLALMLVIQFLTIRHNKLPRNQQSLGMPVVRFGLITMIVIIGHYTPTILIARWLDVPPPQYLSLTAIIDCFGELILAFGVVILAADRMRDELEKKNAQLAELTLQLSEVARTDSLTGLWNRRAFDDSIREHRDKPYPGCLAVIDLNDLKQINDQYLHTAGDAALKVVARALRNKFRVTDPLFRVGGDEFVAILSGGSLGDLSHRMRAIDEELLHRRLPGVDEPLDLIVSWGVAKFDNNTSLGQAYQTADCMMYAQKEQRKAERLSSK